MKVVIVGAGRRGSRIAFRLCNEGAGITFIDKDRVRLENVLQRFDCNGFLGSGTDLEVLGEAGCSEADAFIAVTENDEINIVACGIVASQFNSIKTIAAIKNLGWSGKTGIMGSLLGISEIVNPNVVTARSIYNIINNGIYNNVITFNDSSFILYNYPVGRFNNFVKKTISDVRKESQYNYIVAAIKNKKGTLVPSGATLINDGDVLSIVGKPKELSTLMSNVSTKQKEKLKIVLVGGSMITRFFLKLCNLAQLKNITLIEMRADVCSSFSAEFPQILVLNADITDDTILKDSNLTNHDLLISLTETDELNLITATYAKKLGIVRSIALIRQNINYLSMAGYLGIDSIISTTESTVETVLSKLRGPNVSSIHSIFGGTIEVYEFKIEKNTPVCNKKLSDIAMKKKGIIAAVSTKNSKQIIPNGDYVLKEGDSVLVSVGVGGVKFIQKLFTKVNTK
jgi:trk system potassium uptake protein TrkA